MCFGSVCTHPPYNDKNQPTAFFIPINNTPFFKSSRCQILSRVMSHRPLPRLLIDTGVLSQLRPEWAVISPPLCRRRSRESGWGVLLLDVIMIDLLSISEPLKTCGFCLFLKEMHNPICLNVSIFTQIIRDPALPPEEVSERVYYESILIKC